MADQVLQMKNPGEVRARVPRAVQCPNCFTLNLVESLPATKKAWGGAGLRVTCVLCGTSYSAHSELSNVAA